MADFALWAAACEAAYGSQGTFERAYWQNRRATIENVVGADPVAARVREIMAERTHWTGTASDLLRAGANGARGTADWIASGWPKNPLALAGRLRLAQTFLRTLGIEIAFAREGRLGTRMINITAVRQTNPARSSASSAPSAITGNGAGRRPPGLR
jgi:hypothetical protein